MSLSLTWIICEEISIVINKVFCPPPFAYFVCIKQTLFIGYLSTYFVFGFNLLTLSVFHASVMLLIMNFVITLSKLSANPQLICFLQQQIAVSFVVSNIFTCLSAYWQWLLANERARIISPVIVKKMVFSWDINNTSCCHLQLPSIRIFWQNFHTTTGVDPEFSTD